MEKIGVWNREVLEALKRGEYAYPHQVLGMHKLEGENKLLIRILCPQAKK